jgi:glycosyltransferase involved in cell wall biosynthesis
MRKQRDLSILIPARNEMFLGRTIADILKRKAGNTEVIAVCDGRWPEPPIADHPDVILLYYPEAIGQRAAVNQAARLSTAKFVMKVDAHCAFDKGFDVKLMDDCEYDWTVIPRMYNLHGFDWKCKACGDRIYQGPEPKTCKKCGESAGAEMVMVWKPRRNRVTEAWRFDENMKFRYWRAYSKRPEFKNRIEDVMSSIGACFFMHRERFLELEGLDEKHGIWGQVGTEVACKSWLSGGRHVVNRRTWFAHLFRTRSGFSFPYPLSSKQTNHARRYSNDLWKNNKWPLQKRKLQWLIDKFQPPGWVEQKAPVVETPSAQVVKPKEPSKGLIYYTDNSCEERILHVVRQRLKALCNGWEIISVSQYATDFGRNICLPLNRSVKSMFEQVVRGLQESTADVIFLVEHDVLYHPSHFDVIPSAPDVFYYDHNRWCLCTDTGKAVFYHSDCPSFMCAGREMLLDHYSRVLARIRRDGWSSKYGYSPPKGLPREERRGKVETYMAKYPSIDLRHGNSFTSKRMRPEQFRNESSRKGWTEAWEIPGWGPTKDRFEDFLREALP